jgi:hypothetical protein
MIVPPEPAAKLLTIRNIPVPANVRGPLPDSEGAEARGFIRFVPAGFHRFGLATRQPLICYVDWRPRRGARRG